MKVFRTLPPEPRRNLLRLFTVGLLFWSSMASLLPTLSLYLQHIGASDAQIGLIIGSFAIGLLLFRPWLGHMADNRGRKVVLLLGLVVAAIAPLGYSVSTSMPSLIAVRIVHGVSVAAFTTAYSTLVVDLSPVENRGEVIGYMSLVNPIGTAIGPALGGLVQEQLGYLPLFLLAGGLGLVGWLGATLIAAPAAGRSSSTTMSSTASPSAASPSMWAMLASDRLRVPTLLMLLVGLAFGTLATFVPLYIKDTGVSFNAGWFYTAAAMSSFAVRILVGPASDRLGRGRFISLGIACYAIAMFLLWQAHSVSEFLWAGLIEGAGSGIFLPTMIALLADRSHPQERGRIFSLCISGFDLGIALAGPILGHIAVLLTYRGLFGVAGVLCTVAFCIFLTLSGKNLLHSLRFALADERDVYAVQRPSH